MALQNGFSVKGLEFSPIKGPEGNIEYLIFLEKSNKPEIDLAVSAKGLVNQSHEELL